MLTGVIYPGIVTLIGQLAFPRQAMGSLVRQADGAPAGSLLIGQPFSDPKYFWSRPSATADFPYNPLASGGSNLGPTNPELLKQVADRVGVLKNSGLPGPAPADLVMASGSGLDPHIRLEIRSAPGTPGGRGARPARKTGCAAWCRNRRKADNGVSWAWTGSMW